MLKFKPDIVVVPLIFFISCTDLEKPVPSTPDSVIASVVSPAVTAAVFSPSGADIWFNQAMNQQDTATAVTVYKLNAHVLNGINQAGTAVDAKVTWELSRHMNVTWVFSPGSYVIKIDQNASSVSGRNLDGQIGLGSKEGIHRPDDDWLDAPADYLSQAIHLGNNVPVFESLPPNPYLSVTHVSAWQTFAGGTSAESFSGELWSWGKSRINAFAPSAEGLAYRIQFYSPAGGRYALPTPADVSKFIRILDENGSRLSNIETGLSNRQAVELPFGFEVVNTFGLEITVNSSADGLNLLHLRNPGDRLWMFLGEDASPSVVSAEIASWNVARKSFTLSDMAQPITGFVFGNTVSTQRRWPDGILRGGYALRLQNNQEFSILDATGTTLYLAESTTTADCSGCQVVLSSIDSKINKDDTVLLLSDTWYLIFKNPPPSGLPQFLSLNEDNLLRSFPGTPFRDLERDGDESIIPATPDDEFVMEISFRGANDPVPPFSRLNDGLLYPTVFESADLDCLGSPTNVICATALADDNCIERLVPARAHFSLYTADGEAGKTGAADLIERDALQPEHVLIFGENGRVVLDSVLTNRTVIHPTSSGTFSTTVMTVELAHRDDNGCGGGLRGRRGFKNGDHLIISHSIKTLANVDPRTLDGDHDGIAEASIADDWIGIWDDRQQTFVPFVHMPQRP